ncbi:MAG: DNA-3-methyladenine glycosylase 2 family protein [Candidatus Dormibacteraeota bacterium]|nr:DNA-3-methyladenine glycosylase 2 family protein [Candidatus Dormibacteraeota bacterium]
MAPLLRKPRLGRGVELIAPVARFELVPQGPFDLETEAGRFGGWPRLGDAIVMAFPVEGWRSSAAVVVRQHGDSITGDVHGADESDAERAWQQALATVSLDIDGRGFVEIGRRDPVIGRLQVEYGNLRPVLFHSPYEAACAFIIGHRISIVQTRRIRQRMGDQAGATIQVDGTALSALPDPHALLRLESFPSVAPVKIERLHHVARAALDGMLDRGRLRSLPEDDALTQLRTLPGIGEFFAQGILMRGAGLVDAVTDDEITPRAIQLLYGLGDRPNREAVLQRAEGWRPYRMWAVVLLNVWLRSQPPDVIGRRPRHARSKVR